MNLEGNNVPLTITVTSYLEEDVPGWIIVETPFSGLGNCFAGTSFSETWLLDPATYTWTVTKYGHKPRTGTFTLSEDSSELDVELCPIGDASGDGKLNMGDVAKVYAHIQGISLLTDDYALDCADASCDGKLNMGDVTKIYAHIKQTTPLW